MSEVGHIHLIIINKNNKEWTVFKYLLPTQVIKHKNCIQMGWLMAINQHVHACILCRIIRLCNYGPKLGFDFWCHHSKISISRKENFTESKLQLFLKNWISLPSCTTCWVRNIIDTLITGSFLVTFLVSVLYIFIMVSSVTGILNSLNWT